MNAVVPAITSLGGWAQTGLTGALGAGSAALEGWRAFMGHPSGSTGDDSKRQQDPPKEVKTDVLPNSNTAELPDLPVGIDGNPIKVGLLNSDIGEFSNVPIGIGQYPTDVAATDSTSPSYATTWGTSDPATSLKLFGRRRRIVQSRAFADVCSSHWIDASDPDNPKDAIIPLRFNLNLDVNIPASSYGSFYQWAPGERATVTITQHKRSPDSPGQPYYLDISILDPNGKLLVAQPQVVAPPSQEVEIKTQDRLVLSLFVEVYDAKNDPISFQYGDQFGGVHVTGTSWKSDDSKDHGCVTDPEGDWDESRKIMCFFKV
ncbi:hypothetical protein MMC07_006630 [Pseudocyphellaria aurata]|nr:hypothetical protein [Pseudocyphellaria aurata]